jgi:hypothetical protein
MRTHLITAIPALAGLLLVACGDDTSGSSTTDAAGAPTTAAEAPTTTVAPVIDVGDGGDYHPELDPADFVGVVDHPYFPLAPGNRWVYEETEEGEVSEVVVEVTDQRREIEGISATVVRDTVTLDGDLVEDTFDWYAQDRDGNVWYLGESVDNYENGELVDHEGSWEAGVDGAYAGIVMPAQPQVGDAYRQEYWPGEAEDLGEIIDVGASVEVPAGSFDDVVMTRDWNPLEPDVVEEKAYAPGVGVVREQHVVGGFAEALLISSTLVS